jgi:hypothetical protein
MTLFLSASLWFINHYKNVVNSLNQVDCCSANALGLYSEVLDSNLDRDTSYPDQVICDLADTEVAHWLCHDRFLPNPFQHVPYKVKLFFMSASATEWVWVSTLPILKQVTLQSCRVFGRIKLWTDEIVQRNVHLKLGPSGKIVIILIFLWPICFNNYSET